MSTRNKIWFAGLIFLLLCGPALAHDRVPYDAYPNNGWSGGVVVWSDSRGHTDWSGVVNYTYGIAYGYAPGYIPWAAAHRHGPQCRHGAHHSYGKAHRKAYRKAYRKGYRNGRNHARGHGHDH